MMMILIKSANLNMHRKIVFCWSGEVKDNIIEDVDESHCSCPSITSVTGALVPGTDSSTSTRYEISLHVTQQIAGANAKVLPTPRLNNRPSLAQH